MSSHIGSMDLEGLLSTIRRFPRPPNAREDRKVRAFDFRRSKSTDSDRFTAVREILQRFTAEFGAWIVNYLSIAGHVKLLSVEQTIFAEFANAVSKTAHLTAFQLLPADVPFLCQMDLSVAYPIIDLILGGSGAGMEEVRPFTEIEQQVFDSVSNYICKGLRKASAPAVTIDVRTAGSCTPIRLRSFLPERETMLVANMEIRLGELQGAMQLAFPSAGFDCLTPQVSKPPQPRRVPSEVDRQQLKRVLLNVGFESQLVLPASLVKVQELLSLRPGGVLVLPRRAADPASLQVAGKSAFSAYPVRHGQRRGAKIDKRSNEANVERNSHG